MGEIEDQTVQGRWRAWRTSIQKRIAAGPTKRAHLVYNGSLWNAYLEAFEELQRLKDDAQLWIASAGLGLISGNAEIPGYGATFKRGKKDSVAKGLSGRLAVKGNREWWNYLVTEKVWAETRSLAEILDSLQADELLMAVMGQDYFSALHDDLARSRPRGEVLLVGLKQTGSGLRPSVPPHLRDSVIAFRDFRALRRSLGCNMLQVHACTARALLRHYQKEGDFNMRMEGLRTMTLERFWSPRTGGKR